jgi:Uncharacterized conserved protein
MTGARMLLTDVLSRGWWHLLLRGLAAIAFAILTWFRPGISLAALVLLFGAYALVDGVLAVLTAIAGRKIYDGWWVLLLIGLIGVAVGIMTFMTPGITALALLYYIAFWAIFRGFSRSRRRSDCGRRSRVNGCSSWAAWRRWYSACSSSPVPAPAPLRCSP